MKAERFLKRAWAYESKIQRDREKLDTLKASAYSVSGTAYSDRVQTSLEDRMSTKIGAIADLKSQLIDDIVTCEEIKSEILNQIHTLDDEPMEQVLYLRYVRCESYYTISEETGYSLRNLHRLHNEAVAALDRKLSA